MKANKSMQNQVESEIKKYECLFANNLEYNSNPLHKRFEVAEKFLIGLENSKSVLDVGVGKGHFFKIIKKRGYIVKGIEPANEARKIFGGSDVVFGYSHQIPFENESFDVVACLDVLEHVPRGLIDGSLKEIYRVSKGYAIVSVAHHSDVKEGMELHISSMPFEKWREFITKYYNIIKSEIVWSKSDPSKVSEVYLLEKKRKKIVLISQDFYPITGGIANYLMNIYTRYLKDNCEFIAIVPKSIGKSSSYDKLPFKIKRVNFYPFNIEDQKRNKANEEIMEIVSEFKPDLILFGYLRTHPEIGEEYKKINPKSKFGIFIHAKEAFINDYIVKINNFNGSHKGYTKKEANFYKKIIGKADFIFCVSEFSRSILKKQNIRGNFLVINPVIDLNKVLSRKNPRKKLGYKKDDFIILSVGRLIKRKGHLDVLKALSQMLKEQKNIYYVIVGDGPEYGNLSKYIKSEKLSNKVKIYCKIKDDKLPDFYSSCDVFVLFTKFIRPNDIEGFGIVFLEANAYGKPVIGGANGGVNEAILDKKTGFLVNTYNTLELVKSVEKIIKNPEMGKKMGDNGRNRILREFIGTTNPFIKILEKI